MSSLDVPGVWCILTASNAAASPCFDVRFFFHRGLNSVVYVALNLFVTRIADTHRFVDLYILKLTQESVLVIAGYVYFNVSDAEETSARTIMAFSKLWPCCGAELS